VQTLRVGQIQPLLLSHRIVIIIITTITTFALFHIQFAAVRSVVSEKIHPYRRQASPAASPAAAGGGLDFAMDFAMDLRRGLEAPGGAWGFT